ncbi:auxin-responsive protein SAUR36-like [Macadamia integrifolia]|uniref:auxin-responsive protein SAUR36-like n=1 Tax=Macadamia integrifolia TaxID=60698 RepID=UPI001C4E8998|nr:auxin-responsive protein SAUR36-like [Macadamia integrifolia]
MRKIRGFRLGRKISTVFKWALTCKRKQPLYNRLEAPLLPRSTKSKTMSKICDWGRSLKQGVKGLCCATPASGYNRLGQKPLKAKPATAAPKGYLAVYVREKDGYSHRFLVPVMYFNHPLFAELLRETEREYGFRHPGGIIIPCHVSDFENVKTRIAAGENSRKKELKRRSRSC